MHYWNATWGGPGPNAFGLPWGAFAMSAFFVVLLIVALIAATRAIGMKNRVGGDAKERGIEILIERFVHGEIDSETFKTMKAELDGEI